MTSSLALVSSGRRRLCSRAASASDSRQSSSATAALACRIAPPNSPSRWTNWEQMLTYGQRIYY